AGEPAVSEDDQVDLVIGEREAAGVALLQHGSDMGAHEPAHRAREVVQGYFQGSAVRRRVRSRWPGSRPESLTAPGEENTDRVRTAQDLIDPSTVRSFDLPHPRGRLHVRP